MRRTFHVLTAVGLLASVAVGCGSTAQKPITKGLAAGVLPPTATGVVPSASSDGEPTLPAVGASPGSRRTAPNGGSYGGTASSGEGTGHGGSGPRSSGTPIDYNVQGVTSTAVKVGITYSSDATTYAKVLNPNATLANDTEVAKDIIKHVNAEGGILGRKLEPVFVDEKIGDELVNQPAAEQAVCTSLTQDDKVAWAIDNVANQVDPECFAHAKTPLFDANIAPLDNEAVAAAAPYYHALVSVNAQVYEPVFVDRLIAQHYFTGWNVATRTPDNAAPVKIGVEYPDDPVSTRIYQKYLLPALKAHGLNVAATFAMASNLETRSGQVTSEVLKFRSAGVTHLITLGAMAFTAASGTNGWHPRLAIDTNNQTAGNGGHPEYFKGAVGVGWSPVADLGPGARGVATPSSNQCLGWVHKDLGYSLTSGDSGIYAQVAALCDGILVPTNAMRAARGFSPADLQQGLSDTFRKTPTVSALSQGLTATSWSGVTEVRDLTFNAKCYCNRYGNHVTRLP